MDAITSTLILGWITSSSCSIPRLVSELQGVSIVVLGRHGTDGTYGRPKRQAPPRVGSGCGFHFGLVGRDQHQHSL